MNTVIPAYGRDYKSAAAAKADWEAHKDFLMCDFFSKWNGHLINKGLIKGPVKIRYLGQTKVTTVTGGLK